MTCFQSLKIVTVVTLLTRMSTARTAGSNQGLFLLQEDFRKTWQKEEGRLMPSSFPAKLSELLPGGYLLPLVVPNLFEDLSRT